AAPDMAGEAGAVTEAGVAATLAASFVEGVHSEQVLPGPTGESNRLTLVPRSPVLCLGPSAAAASCQADMVRALGGHAVDASGLEVGALTRLQGFSGAIWWGDAVGGRDRAQALAARNGPILPLIGGQPDRGHALMERHVCIDTTASGGNAQLLAEAAAA
ncbi:MAG: bifunctional proline dehydrogenase/L-glutamate gamma-semialdehyde dehydrogenase, partial [Candidatus Saccharibacteria bacterium]|nr:bifunctional proline dehydrogenase/L-glutamate gamma-semialdehyde dehydrogenase [Pseudorhodobacter sp.]